MGRRKKIQKTGTGFIGFGGSSTPSASSPSTNPTHSSATTSANPGISVGSLVHTSAVQGLPPNVLIMFRKMGKKDKSTQVKGLKELGDLATASPDAIDESVLGAWVEAYLKLYIDDARKVRVQLNTTHGQVAAAAGSKLGKVLKRLMGPWLCALSDPSPEVRSAANSAFHTTFAPEKRATAMKFTGKALVAFLTYNLGLDIETLLALVPGSRDQGQVRLVSLKAASLGALAQFLTYADPETVQALDLIAFCHDNVYPELLTELLHAPEPIGFGQKAVFGLVISLAKHLPAALVSTIYPIAPEFGSAGFAPLTPATVVSAAWDALLSLLSADPEDVAAVLDLPALLLSLARHVGSSPPPSTLTSLLPFLSLILPLELFNLDAFLPIVTALLPSTTPPGARASIPEARFLELTAYLVANGHGAALPTLLTVWLSFFTGPGKDAPRPTRPLCALFRTIERVCIPDEGHWDELVHSLWIPALALSPGSDAATVRVIEIVADDAPAAAAILGRALLVDIASRSQQDIQQASPLMASILSTGLVQLEDQDPQVQSGEWLWSSLATTMEEEGVAAALARYGRVLAVYATADPSVATRILEMTSSTAFCAWVILLRLDLVSAETNPDAAALVVEKISQSVSEPSLATLSQEEKGDLAELILLSTQLLSPEQKLAFFDLGSQGIAGLEASMLAGTTLLSSCLNELNVFVSLVNASTTSAIDVASRERVAHSLFWFRAVQISPVADRVALAWETLAIQDGFSDALLEDLTSSLWNRFAAYMATKRDSIELPHLVPEDEWMSPYLVSSLVFQLVTAARNKETLDTLVASLTDWASISGLDALHPLSLESLLSAEEYLLAAEAYVELSWRLSVLSELVRMMSYEMVFSHSSTQMVLGTTYVNALAAARVHLDATRYFEEVQDGFEDRVEAKPLGITGSGSKELRPELDLDDLASTSSQLPEYVPHASKTAGETVALFFAEWGLSYLSEGDWTVVVTELIPGQIREGPPVVLLRALSVLLRDALGNVLDGPEARTLVASAVRDQVLSTLPLESLSAPDVAAVSAVVGFASETLDPKGWRAQVGDWVLGLLVSESPESVSAGDTIIREGLTSAAISDATMASIQEACLAGLDTLAEPGRMLSGPTLRFLLRGMGSFPLLGVQHGHVQRVLEEGVGSRTSLSYGMWGATRAYIRYAVAVDEVGSPSFQQWATRVLSRGLGALRALRKVSEEVYVLAAVPSLGPMTSALVALVGIVPRQVQIEVKKKAELLLGPRSGEEIGGSVSVAGFELLRAVYKVASAGVVSACAGSSGEGGEGVVRVGRGSVARFVSASEAWSGGGRVGLFGHLLGWKLVLDHARDSGPSAIAQVQHATEVLTAFEASLRVALSCAFGAIESAPGGGLMATGFHPISVDEVGPNAEDLLEFGATLFVDTLKLVPKPVRSWWRDAPREGADDIHAFVRKHVSPVLIESALEEVESMESSTSSLKVKVSSGLRRVSAVYSVDEVDVELVLTVPESYPLVPVEIESGSAHKAVSKSQWRRWILSLRVMLETKLASLRQVIEHWHKCMDSEFEGVEECAICYYVIHFESYEIPSMECSTCHNKFHPPCLLGWFDTSQASTCPLCRSPF